MFNLRKASIKDAEAIWSVRTSAIRAIEARYYSKEDLEKWAPLDMPSDFPKALAQHTWYVVETHGEIIATGFIDLERATTEAIFVKANFQGRGIAKMMLEHLETIAKSYGLKELSLDATLNAEGFYKKQGYQSLEKSIWKSPRGIDMACVKMHKNLK
jgi:GNAT superfamily N-acetyltransferase